MRFGQKEKRNGKTLGEKREGLCRPTWSITLSFFNTQNKLAPSTL